MPTETEEIKPTDLEQTPEFQSWLQAKTQECLRYLKLSFNVDLPAEELLFYPEYLGYPDQVGQLRSHARIWGYNYKINGENAINPATNQAMAYVVWQVLDIPENTPKEAVEGQIDAAPAEPSANV